MIIHNVIQGSPEWLALRAGRNTASEASAMMGVSPYTTRNELVRMAATGTDKEFSDWVQENLLDKGHEIEEAARPIAEEIIGQELYPCTATSDEEVREHLLASFDGVTMDESVTWECKSWNKEKADHVVNTGTVPPADHWQVVQQLVVSRASKCLYMVTDGTKENTVHCWVTLAEGEEQDLLAHWEQFNKDVAACKPEDVPAVEVVAEVVEDLPAVYVQVSGGVTVQDNFATFEDALRYFLSDVLITDPQTDQDFADLDQQIKAMKRAEDALDSAEVQMLAQVQEVNDLKRAKDALHDLVRKNRLQAEKLLKAQKDKIRLEIRQGAEQSLRDHLAQLEKTMGCTWLPNEVTSDFAGAMKNKRTIESLRNAVDTELARVIVDSNKKAEHIRANLLLLDDKTADYQFLFLDRAVLARRDRETLELMIDQRISKHQADEAAKLEAERERIRKEELVNMERERLAVEAAKAREEAAAALQAEAAEVAETKPEPAPVPEPAPTPAPAHAQHKYSEISIELDGVEVAFNFDWTPANRETRYEPGYPESIDWHAQDKVAAAFIEHFGLHDQIEELIWKQIEAERAMAVEP